MKYGNYSDSCRLHDVVVFFEETNKTIKPITGEKIILQNK